MFKSIDVLFFTSSHSGPDGVPYFSLAVQNLKGISSIEIKHKSVSKIRFSGFKNIPFSKIWGVCLYKTAERISTESHWVRRLRWKLVVPIKFISLIIRFMNYVHTFEVHPSRVIVVWNGLKEKPAIAALAGEMLGRKVCFSEIGVMSNTSILDCKGITADSSIPQDPEFYRNTDFYLKHGSIPNREVEIRKLHCDREIDDKGHALPKNYIFIPFQQVDDSSILLHSPFIKSMEEFFDWVCYIALKADKDITFVLKEHPSERRSYSKLHDKLPKNIVFLNGIPTPTLIENASLIITINSMVGMEALLFHKKIITLGASWYSFEPLVRQASSKENLFSLVQSTNLWQVDKKLIESYLSYVFYEYSLPDSYQFTSNKHWLSMAKKIQVILEKNS